MFSAEGAAFIAAWGSAPGRCRCEGPSAESANHSEQIPKKKLPGDTTTPQLHPILIQRKGIYDVYKNEILVAISKPPDQIFPLAA